MLTFLLIHGCTSQSEPTVLFPSNPLEAHQEFAATVRIDAEAGSKQFQGVWLERADGEQWVIDYRPRDCWLPLENLQVKAVGNTYMPPGQAISATHFRVSMLEVIDPAPEARLVAVGPEETMTGTLQAAAGEAGSKSEGSSWLVFKSDSGSSWTLYNPSALGTATGSVTLTGRMVQLSPYSAHAAGPQLCVLRVQATP